MLAHFTFLDAAPLAALLALVFTLGALFGRWLVTKPRRTRNTR